MSTAVIDFDTTSARREGQRRPAEPVVGRPREQAPSVRLTRRGRLALVVAMLALLGAAFVLVGGAADSTGTTHHAAAETVVVASGQTLWDIAGTVAPGQDRQDVIAEIVRLNSLPDAGAIRVGQPLYVPEY